MLIKRTFLDHLLNVNGKNNKKQYTQDRVIAYIS